MPANNQKKIIATIIGISMLAFGLVEQATAQVGLSVGSNSLNLTDPGHNLFYGLTSGSTATGSFMKFQKGAGNTVFQVDYNGNITTTGSFSSGLTNNLTTNYIPKWNTNTLANSLIYDNGSGVGVGTTTLGSYKLNIAGSFSASDGNVVGDTSGNINFESFIDRSNALYKLDPSSSANSLNVAGSITALGTSNHNYFAGRVGIRNSNPGAQLEVEIGNSGAETFLLSDSFNNYGLRTGHNGYAGLFGYQQGNDTGSGDSYGTVLSLNAFYNGTSWSTRNGWIRPSFINLGLGGNIIFATQSAHQSGTAGVYTPTEVMRITNSGNVGIGVASPDGTLHVYGGASTSKITLSRANVTNYKAVLDYSLSNLNFGTASGDGMTFMTNGVTRMTFGSAGNVSIPSGNNFAVDTNTLYVVAASDFVGIGTSTPDAKLTIKGGNIFVHDALITSLTPKAVVTKEYLDSSLSSTTASIITQVSTSSFWQGQLNNDIWANNTLNVGIGTTDPGVKLDVVGGAIRTNNQLISTIANGTAPLSVVSATQVNNLTSQYAGSLRVLSPNAAIDYNTMSYGRTYDYGSGNTRSNGPTGMSYGSVYNFGGGNEYQLSLQMAADIYHNSTTSTRRLWFRTGNNLGFQNDWKEIYHSGNLTNNLSAGYMPKWNGSSFINSVAYDDGANIGIGTTGPLSGKLHVNGTGYFVNTVTVGTPTAGGHATTRDYVTQALLNKLTAQSIGTLDVNAIGDGFVLYGGSTSSWLNRGPSGHNGGAIFHITTHPGGYYSDLWFDTANNRMYSRAVNAGTIGAWSLFPKVSTSTANYLTKWSSEDSLTRSIIYDNGSGVGIGTTGPTQTLDISGNILARGANVLFSEGGTTNREYIYSNDSGITGLNTSGVFGFFADTSLGGSITSPTAGISVKGIYSNGSVGIGTSTPSAALEVLSGGTYSILAGNKRVGNVASPVASTDAVNRSYVDTNFAPIGGGASLWATSSAGTYNVGLGNVGIGTTNPASKLDVSGNLNATSFSGNGSKLTYVNRSILNIFESSTSAGQWVKVGSIDFSTMAYRELEATYKVVAKFGVAEYSVRMASGLSGQFYSPYIYKTSSAGVNVPELELYQVDSGTNVQYELYLKWDSNYIQTALVEVGFAEKQTGDYALMTYATTSPFISSIPSGRTKVSTVNFFALSNVGNVGIDITTPRVKLDVSGANSKIRLANNVQNAGEVGVEFSHSTYAGLSEVKNAILTKASGGYGRGDMYFILDSAADSNGYSVDGVDTKMMIRNDGNIGIGTTEPSAKLEIQGTNSQLRLFNNTATAVPDVGGVIDFGGRWSTGSSLLTWAQIKGYKTGASGSVAGYLSFITNSGAGNDLQERMRIINSGYVGIGTTTPAAGLEVLSGATYSILAGNKRVGNVASPVASTDAVNRSYVDTNFAPIGGGASLWATSSVGTYNVGLGKVGVGTTNPFGKLSVSGVISSGIAESNNVGLNDWTSINANYMLAGPIGYWGLRTATNHSVNFDVHNSNSPITALSILQNGNVGISNTNPQEKLDLSSGIMRQSGYLVSDAATDNMLVNGDFEMNGAYGWAGSLSVVAGGVSGNYTAQITGSASITTKDFIPVDPTKDIFQLEAWLKKTVAGTTPGVLYFGYMAYDANKTLITSAPCGTYCYFAASGYNLPADGNWHKVSATTVGEGTSYPNFPVGTRYVKVMGLINYSSSADSVTQLDHVTLKRITKGPLIAGNNFSSTNIVDNNQYSTLYTTAANNLVVSSPGNVGIGTTNPTASLEVLSGGTYSILAGSKRIGNVASPVASTDAVNRSYVDTNFAPIGGGASLWATSSAGTYNVGLGSVGIGTTTPTERLEVNGNIKLSGASPYINYGQSWSSGAFTIRNNNTTILSLSATGNQFNTGPLNFAASANYTLGTSDNYALAFKTNNAERMRIDNLGKVGIYTTDPGVELEVSQGVYNLPATSGTEQTGGLRVSARSSGNVVLDMGISNPPISSWIQSTNRSDLSQLYSLSLNPNGGNVGIGTTTPNAGLEVLTGSTYSILAGNRRLGNLASPVNASDAVTKSYVDGAFMGYHVAGVTDIHNIPTSTTNSMYTFFSSAAYPANSPVASSSWVQGIQFPLASNLQYRQILASNNSDLYYGSQGGGVWSAWRKIWDSGNLTNNLTANYLPKWNTTTLANSLIYDNGSGVGIGTANPGSYKLNVAGSFSLSNGNAVGDTSGNITFESFVDKTNVLYKLDPSSTGTSLNVAGSINALGTAVSNYFAGNIGIGTNSPVGKLQINGNWTANPGGTNTIYTSSAGFASNNLSPQQIITSDSASLTPGASIGLALHNNNATAGAYSPMLVFSKRESGASNYNSSIAAIAARTVTGSGSGDSWIDGDLMFYTAPTNGSGLLERMRITQDGNVGIGTTTPGMDRLSVDGNTRIIGGLYVSGEGSFSDLRVSNKLTVNTIDPLYRIKGVNYSTFAPSFVGGVKEEVSGRLKISEKTGDEYQAVIDFAKQRLGSDLWVWYNVIDFNKDTVEAIITPYGSFANVYYYISGTRIVFKADRPAEISYRLLGKRFDWRQWPTKAVDQTEKPSFIID